MTTKDFWRRLAAGLLLATILAGPHLAMARGRSEHRWHGTHRTARPWYAEHRHHHGPRPWYAQNHRHRRPPRPWYAGYGRHHRHGRREPTVIIMRGDPAPPAARTLPRVQERGHLRECSFKDVPCDTPDGR